MSGFGKVVPCAAIAAVLFAGSAQLTGQAPVENGRSVALAASDDTLRAALNYVDAMLTGGRLNISSVHDDTMIAGRAIERLGQFHEGLPVFGGQVVRQMDGRAIVSVTGRLYEALDVDVTPSIPAARANEIAAAAAGAGASIRGETTLGILPVENGYRLVYHMVVLSSWAIRDVYVDAGTGQIVLTINGIHTQAAIGQGNGIFGTLRKMSTNRTSTTFQAVDKLRPGEAFTLAFPGTPARLNFFLADARALQFGRGDRQRQRVDRWPDGGCARVSGMGVRLLLQAVRPARHGRSQHRGRRHRPPARTFGGESAAP